MELDALIKKITINKAKRDEKASKSLANRKAKSETDSKVSQFQTSYSRNLDGYVRPELTEQDKISAQPEEVKKRFKDFDKIEKDDYQYVKPGTYIRYLKSLPNGQYKYCVGGYLHLNKSPDYWILKNSIYGNKNRTWSVQLKCNNIYYKKKGDTGANLPENTVNEIYKKIKSGEYRLIKVEHLEMLLKHYRDNTEGEGGVDFYIVTLKKIKSESDEDDNSDEDKSSETVEDSDEDEDVSKMVPRPSTVVELV